MKQTRASTGLVAFDRSLSVRYCLLNQVCLIQPVAVIAAAMETTTRRWDRMSCLAALRSPFIRAFGEAVSSSWDSIGMLLTVGCIVRGCRCRFGWRVMRKRYSFGAFPFRLKLRIGGLMQYITAWLVFCKPLLAGDMR